MRARDVTKRHRRRIVLDPHSPHSVVHSSRGTELATQIKMKLARYSLRQMILALVLIGIVGLIVELLLQKHFDSATQWIPIVSLGLGLATTAVVARNPTRVAMQAFVITMLVFVAAGVLGLVLHFKGNVEWALERNPELGGMTLIWKALTGATPALAPGALAQLGLLGLAWSYRHPAVHTAQTGSTNMEIDK